MKPNDKAALQLALDQMLARGGADEAQLRNMLAERSWREAAEFAAFCRQCESLQCRPWDCPPCSVDPSRDPNEYGGRPVEVQLLTKMLALNVSRYHPDPVRALERIGPQARGVKLGGPRLAVARKASIKARSKAADAFAANVRPIIREIQESGVGSLRGVARALTARGVRTARGGDWTAVQVSDILRR